jgi:hypothetical protein
MSDDEGYEERSQSTERGRRGMDMYMAKTVLVPSQDRSTHDSRER